MSAPTRMTHAPRTLMHLEPTQVEIDALHARANIKFNEQDYDDNWKRDLAADLNIQIGHVLYCLETTADSSDYSFGVATMNIIERVAHFEELNILPMD
jgi:predicted transposase YbfD/YdcC